MNKLKQIFIRIQDYFFFKKLDKESKKFESIWKFCKKSNYKVKI
jgi:hypothetical protein